MVTTTVQTKAIAILIIITCSTLTRHIVESAISIDSLVMGLLKMLTPFVNSLIKMLKPVVMKVTKTLEDQVNALIKKLNGLTSTLKALLTAV